MSGALSQSALVASQMGLSVEDTTGSLAAFASAGLMGSDAGTSFRSMLMRLQNPTDEAAEAMSALGIAAYDANGEFVGIDAIAGQLQQSMKNLAPAQRDAAMATLFGADAVRAANILYNEGEEGIRGWIAAVDDQGYASEQAEARLDNLKGDNAHHQAETVFKAFGRALRMAVEVDPRTSGVPSTKGTLSQ